MRASHVANRVGALCGVPMTIKDAIEVGGMRSTGGAVELRDHVPLHDAPVVASLRAAGAIIFGKTNLPPWCSADTETNNELFGTTNNPWDLTRSVGGSSGGSAAAVAAGLSSCEIGTDIGGSVRMPVALLRRVRLETDLWRRPATRLLEPRRRRPH